MSDKRCCPTDAGPAACHYTPAGDDFYVAGPLDAKAGILLVGDIFGMQGNTKRTVDDLAKAGFLVVMPDFFHDKAWEESKYPPASYEDPEWVAFYKLISDQELHHPLALRAVALMRKLGVQKIAALGLCWGAVLSMRLSAELQVDAVSTAHPSNLTAEAVKGVKTPICILAAVDDKNMEEVEPAVAALDAEPKFFKRYSHVHHGFLGARFDFENAPAEQVAERKDAFAHLLAFYEKTLH